ALESLANWEYKIDNGSWQAGTGNFVNAAHGNHSYSVHQTDLAGNVSAESARIIVNYDHLPPALLQDNFNLGINENTSFVTTLLTIHDHEPQPVWALASGGDNAYFNISPTGVLSFKTAPNYEMPRNMLASVSNTPHYSVYIQMTDAAGNTSIVALNVIVQDVNEAPFVLGPVPTQNILRGQAYRLDVHNSFRDPDAANTDLDAVDLHWGVLTYTTTDLPVGLHMAENGIITGTANTSTTTVVTVTATDGGGLSVTQTFNLNVVDGVSVQSFTVQDAGNGNGNQLGLRGEMLTFRLVLSEAVTVTGGTPTVTFSFNGTEHVTASYISGSGSDTLLFAGASAMAPSGDGNDIFLRAIDLGSAQVLGTTTGLAWNSTLIGHYHDGYTVDNIPPHLPTLTLASDTGSSASDQVTNNATINVSGLDSGATWQYQVDGTADSWLMGTGSSFTASSGTHRYFVRQTDVAGNISTQSNAVTYTLDNSAPATPSLTLASDTGSSASDGLTYNATINVGGLESGATWQYQVD
ncbi:MAG: Ig-like domain-containing protein, partial [Methylophilaceae bacterium]|nr:Ig-like domain-containing protein [Methylophilaceae bacterium]